MSLKSPTIHTLDQGNISSVFRHRAKSSGDASDAQERQGAWTKALNMYCCHDRPKDHHTNDSYTLKKDIESLIQRGSSRTL